MENIKQEIRKYIVDSFLFGDNGTSFTDDDSFMENAILDSTGILDIILFIEEKYGIKVEDDETLPENLDSLNNLEKLLKDSIEAVATNNYFPSLGFSFHMEIAKISRNTLLYKFLESITLELMAQRKLLVLSHLSKKDLLKEIEEQSTRET